MLLEVAVTRPLTFAPLALQVRRVRRAGLPVNRKVARSNGCRYNERPTVSFRFSR
jgi:hypothetical protein